MPAMVRVLLGLLTGLLAPALSAGELRIGLTDQHGRPVGDAVVTLTPVGDASDAPGEGLTFEIVQSDQEFAPYVTVVPVGATVVFPNRDTVQHHVYSLSRPKKFEFPLYDPGKSAQLVFDQPGVITLGCNIHDWMLAYLVVVSTPHFAQSNATGQAALAAPSGDYTLEIWHPRLSRPVRQTVQLTDADTPLNFTLRLRSERRIRRAPSAEGGGYN